MRRRTLLTVGAAVAGTTGLGLGKVFSQLLDPDNLPPNLDVRPSPPVTPFVAPLQIPAVKTPVPLRALKPGPVASRHQRFEEYFPRKVYTLRERQFLHRYHPEYPPTPSWGYDGAVPGPTFHARYGEPVLIRRFNQLPAGHTGYGLPSTTMHLHNMHTASESDGFPMDFIESGQYWDHHYAMFPAGFDPREQLSTLWYHDHRMDFTAANVYAGLTGFFLAFDDDKDTGDENDPRPGAFRLPSGKYDVPLILHDVLFDPDGKAYFDIYNVRGFLGDRYTVNRIIQPYFQVEARKYRFRIVNGGPSRFYELALSNGHPLTVISGDGNLLPAPIELDALPMAVAERNDVIIDFSRYQPGTQIVLLNRLEQYDGAGPSGRRLDPGEPVMRFDVIPSQGPDNSRVPESLIPLPDINLTEVVREREWVFDFTGGLWTINNQTADMNVPAAVVDQGTAEILTIRNAGGSWSHPVHFHFEEFQFLEINGKPVPDGSLYKSRKDVFWLGPGDTAKVFLRFRNFHGQYILHCHNVVHEDHAMMLRWDIADPEGGARQG